MISRVKVCPVVTITFNVTLLLFPCGSKVVSVTGNIPTEAKVVVGFSNVEVAGTHPAGNVHSNAVAFPVEVLLN